MHDIIRASMASLAWVGGVTSVNLARWQALVNAVLEGLGTFSSSWQAGTRASELSKAGQWHQAPNSIGASCVWAVFRIHDWRAATARGLRWASDASEPRWVVARLMIKRMPIL
jgi:hypothetical protein